MQKTFSSEQRNSPGLFKPIAVFAHDAWAHRYLIWQLFRRDFLMTYKKSFFGMGWHLIAPLTGIASWLMLNWVGVFQPGGTTTPYAVYLLLGTSFWGLFMSLYQGSANTLYAGGGFISQVGYPHHILLFKECFQQYASFGISFTICLGICFIAYPNSLSLSVFAIPLMTIPILLFACSMGLIAALLRALSMDFGKVLEVFVGSLIYITPIIFTPHTINVSFNKVMQLNPLTHLITEPRNIILNGSLSSPKAYILSSLLALLLFLLSTKVFYTSEQKLVEKML